MARYLLALDQASKVTGYSVFDLDTQEYVESGHWSIPGEDKLSMEERLFAFQREINKAYDKYLFDKLVYEDIQLQRGNVKTFKTLAYIQAAILLWKMIFVERICLSPSHWRSVLKKEYGIEWGRKRTEQKAAAQEFVKQREGITLTEDEADSYCIGLAYLLEKDKPTSAF